MKTIVSLSAMLSLALVLILIVPGSASAAPNQQGQINSLENEVRQLQAQLQQEQAQLQQALAQAQQLQTQLQQSQTQVQQLQTQVQQLQGNANGQVNGQVGNAVQNVGVEQTMTLVPPVPTTPASEIENSLNAIPADMLPKTGDSDVQRGQKMASIKSFLTNKLADHNVRITGKLETANISLTTKDHLYVELAPFKSDDITWRLQGLYLPEALTKTFKAMDADAMVQIDAEVLGCEVKDISGPGATHPVLELKLQIRTADAHKPM